MKILIHLGAVVFITIIMGLIYSSIRDVNGNTVQPNRYHKRKFRELPESFVANKLNNGEYKVVTGHNRKRRVAETDPLSVKYPVAGKQLEEYDGHYPLLIRMFLLHGCFTAIWLLTVM